jgi:transposase-like protein
MDTTCASCHGGRVYGEYTGAKDDYEADVHYDNEEMVCMDCHQSTEMHASASLVTTRLDLAEQPTCESCHPDTTEENTENRSHAIHATRLPARCVIPKPAKAVSVAMWVPIKRACPTSNAKKPGWFLKSV